MYKPDFNSEKFRALVLYAAHRSLDDPWFGAVKLNKILYYCDFRAFHLLQHPITGATYVKFPEGPVPREMLSERQALLDEGLATMKYERFFRYLQHRLIPTSENVEALRLIFNNDDLEIIDSTLAFLSPYSGKEASDLSHQEVGWILARDREAIPYETAWMVPKTDVDIAALLKGSDTKYQIST